MIKALLLTTICLGSPVLKVRVDGDGYLRFIRDGRAVYAKEAALQVTDGKLTDSAGDSVLPSIQVGASSDIQVDLEGNIYAVYNGAKVKAGQLVLAQFPANEAFQKQDVVLTADDRPHLGTPGDDTLGVIRLVAGFDVPVMKVTINPAPQATVVDSASAKRSFLIPDSIANKIVQSAQSKQNVARPINAANHGTQITVQQHSVVTGEHIMLGQVAQIDGDPETVAKLQNVDLGDTPPTGVKRVIDRTRIMIRLRFAGLKPEAYGIEVPDGADIRRKGQTIPNSDFVVAAIKAILNNNATSGTWESVDSFADLEVPSGKLELKAEEITGLESGNASVIVAIIIDGTRFNSRTVHLKLKDNVPPVQVGAAVKVIMIAGRAQVEMSGVAHTGGRLGQSIQVEVQVGNPAVKTFHTGIVTGPGTVEVRL